MKPGAQRYDAHEPASFNNLMPLAESLRLLLEATPALAFAHAKDLCDRRRGRAAARFEPRARWTPGSGATSSACARARPPRPRRRSGGSTRRR